MSTLSGGNQQKVVIAKWLMTEPRIILLNDPTRGIDVGTKQELYRLMRELADQGAAILFYSTDYDELIGCCDRVAIMYDGRIVRELAGDESTRPTSWRVRSTSTPPARQASFARAPMSSDLAIRIRQNFAFLTAVALFCVVYLLYHFAHPKGFSSAVFVQNGDEVFTLALVAMAQTVPVLAGGLDLSVGALMTMVGCFASYLLSGAPEGTPLAIDFAGWRVGLGTLPGGAPGIVLGIVICLAIGVFAGLINGRDRRLRPHPADHCDAGDGRDLHRRWRVPASAAGGKVDDDLNWALTNSLGDFASTFHFFNDGAAPWFVPCRRTGESAHRSRAGRFDRRNCRSRENEGRSGRPRCGRCGLP